ncbi:MAG: HNH endonuclease [Planctomycetes bacterium]|nr:HNH endonuclease [Planctomycetota bacterium]
MLAAMRDMRPGYRICLRHRHDNSGSVLVAFGKVTSNYYFSSKRNADLFEGHDCSHRVDVDWEPQWFEAPRRPKLPSAVWKKLFHIEQGLPLIEIGPERWRDLQKAAKISEADQEDRGLYPGEEKDVGPLEEGRVRRVVVEAIERNPVARRQCLAAHGVSCAVCGFNFAESFGAFAQGFIHVHHLKPLSKASKPRKVDPKKDLRPVCPNCHAALHMRTPPYKIDELRELLGRVRS